MSYSESHLSYLHCDAPGCENYYESDCCIDMEALRECAGSEEWTCVGDKDFCPEHSKADRRKG